MKAAVRPSRVAVKLRATEVADVNNPLLPAANQPRADAPSHARAVAGDASQPLLDRLEAFEDIFESEVGDTTLLRARNLEREVGLRQIYLKFEGGNPTGTQKDRIAFAQVLDALRRGYDTVTVATCGNYGAAIGLACRYAGLSCAVYMPAAYTVRRVAEMEAQGLQITRVDGDYEDAVAASRAVAVASDFYDANPGGDNTVLQMRAYGEIAYEIYDELRDAPAAVAVPVSNGTTLAGIHKGFNSLYRRGKTSHHPAMVAGSSPRKNPIISSMNLGHATCVDIDPKSLRETGVNEPLINWHSFDGDVALRALRDSAGWAGSASDRRMKRQAQQLREQLGIDVLPASTAGLIALLDRHSKSPLPPGRYVALLHRTHRHRGFTSCGAARHRLGRRQADHSLDAR